jgi:hypothetical protein
MDESEVEEGDSLGVSLGDPAVVDGTESAVVAVVVRCRTFRGRRAVEAIVVLRSEDEGIRRYDGRGQWDAGPA